MGYNVAIDGPAGAGKSTIAKQVAKENGYIYVDTGAMYRGLAIHFLNLGIDPKDTEKIIEACKDVEVTIGYESGIQQIYVNGENVTAKLRTEEVGNMASMTSAIPEVREKLLELQRTLAREKDVIMDGRDIGTHVLPDADVKIYLTASVEIRAKRRYKELVEKGVQCDLKEIEKDIEERDYRDMTRKIAPLKKAEDASLAKTSFLHNMSHDIRTPMNAVLGYAQLMKDELKGKGMPETLEHLEKLQQSGNLLLSIINNVLDMARIESGRMEIDENYGMIEDIWQTLFEIFDDEAKKKNIALHYTINVEHEHILTDVTKVKEIFVNILSNTMKYTPSGGSVMINVDELPCSEPGYMIVRTRVSDTGIGMSQEYLTNIFEAFTRERNTTKSKIAGTGLGMSIVKKYVELLGGTIDVESELGKGSTFTVTLKHKIADENYYVKNYAENPETYSEILKDRKILLAEDNDLNAEIAEAILERAGLKTERVEDGIQCVNKIEKMPAGTYDMILMDIQMPKMNGYKATQAIRRLTDKDKACIPIVAMTANAFEEDKRDAFAAGMNGHIAKPIQVDKLLSTLAEVWGKEMTDETDCHM